MIETTDLTSYYPGYDEYCKGQEKPNRDCDYESILVDMYHDEMMLRKEIEKMEREIIDLETENILFDDSLAFTDYVWKGSKLIPIELLEGE